MGFDIVSVVLQVPEKINNVPVTKIAKHAFSHSRIKEVYLPNSISEIEQGAFSYCFELEIVSFYLTSSNNQHIRIGRQAFCFCTSLNTVYAPTMNASLDPYGFAYCEIMANFNMSINALKGLGFIGCIALSQIDFHKDAIIEDVFFVDLPKLYIISFGGNATIAKNVLQKIHENNLQIICSPDSNLIDLVYSGFVVKVQDNVK
mgnify:CR=1 FL=1